MSDTPCIGNWTDDVSGADYARLTYTNSTTGKVDWGRIAELERELSEAKAELRAAQEDVQRLEHAKIVCGYIANAKRFDKQFFDDDTSFADWAQSWCRHTLQVQLAKPDAARNGGKP